ncbi:MAG: C40 family peptidase [Leptolyngbya sp. SIO4C1]|nr:C40 family peptidase [Leptolyngbya sp. SIO4C1]
MVSIDLLKTAPADFLQKEFRCDRTLNLYKTSDGAGLVTQAAAGRPLKITEIAQDTRAVRVCLCEDDYPGWLPAADLAHLSVAPTPYQAPQLSAADIQDRLPQVITFTQAAMAVPNQYLWGGTVAPNYDCSGLMQAAFRSAGIPLPRDSYQQAAFTQRIERSALQPGDLIFFSNTDRITHVALYLGHGQYIHSSGKDKGRNGIGIDSITDLTHPVSWAYYQQIKSFGRVMRSYIPKN